MTLLPKLAKVLAASIEIWAYPHCGKGWAKVGQIEGSEVWTERGRTSAFGRGRHYR